MRAKGYPGDIVVEIRSSRAPFIAFAIMLGLFECFLVVIYILTLSSEILPVAAGVLFIYVAICFVFSRNTIRVKMQGVDIRTILGITSYPWHIITSYDLDKSVFHLSINDNGIRRDVSCDLRLFNTKDIKKMRKWLSENPKQLHS